ncbi:MAG: hypothetical protein ACKVPZ_10715 [Burkholderiaceae bacterium]|jgi:uncharacterized protein with HEPN domain
MTSSDKNTYIIEKLLEITGKEVMYFQQSRIRVINSNVDIKWIEALDENPQHSEMLDAFVARFSRLQDAIGDKLLPTILKLNLETVGSQLDNLFRAEKLGWIESADQWIELRGLRNSLIHEYMTNPENLLYALKKVIELGEMLIKTHNLLADNFKNKLN